MNQKLIKLYEMEMVRLKKAQIKSYNFDGPLLMHSWEDEYQNSEFKILFLGRESNGWHGDLKFDVKECILRYIDFELCNNGRYTTFWQYIYDIKNILMPKTIGQRNFLWSNVSKFSNLDGTAISFNDFCFFSDNFNVLQSEIDILKPNVIIFFTGNSWDTKIQYQIKSEIKFEQVESSIPSSELSKLISKSFPFHTYRIDHPITLQTQKKWNYIELIIKDILTSR